MTKVRNNESDAEGIEEAESRRGVDAVYLSAKDSPEAAAQRRLRQAVGFRIVFARYVRDRELQRSRQLPAGPVQRIEARTAAGVFAGHLPYHHLGIRINVKFTGSKGNCVLQGFHQGSILGDVVVLVADPLGDSDGAAGATVDHDANTRRPGISQATAIHVGHEFGHHCDFRCFLQDALIPL